VVGLAPGRQVRVRAGPASATPTPASPAPHPTTEFDKKVIPSTCSRLLLEKVNVCVDYHQPGDFASAWSAGDPDWNRRSGDLGVTSDSETTGEAFAEYGDGLSFSGDGGQRSRAHPDTR
jgi:hypothetical protein